MTDKTTVVFRRWKATGDVIAVMPRNEDTHLGCDCLCYEHIGQHGEGVKSILLQGTTQTVANAPDVKALKAELEKMGYEFDVHDGALGTIALM